MTVLTSIIVLLIAGLVAYYVTKINTMAGAYVTVVATLAGLALYLIQGDSILADDAIGIIQFTVTPLGWFFSVLMLVVYSMVAFFNPFWMKKMLHPSVYNMLFLFSLAGTLGVFMADHFLVLFIFWEIVVWSSLFIIPIGKSRQASVVYYAMSTFGSFTMLYAIFMLYATYDSFNINYVLSAAGKDPEIAIAAFVLILLAGLVKLGVFPFHIWLPMAHGNAPDTFSPILSGGLVKMGAFAAILVTAVLPIYKAFDNQVTIMGVPILVYGFMLLGAVSIVVGTLMAIKQEDAKKLLAYSSVANAGYILIGILLSTQLSMSGALVHIFAHAIASAAAFLSIAAVSYRAGTTKMSELGGLIQKMPITYLVYLIAIISMAGIPPMAGFISKWLLFQALASQGMFVILAAMFFGSVGSFLYVFRPLSAVFLGQLKPQHKAIKEAPAGMLIPMVALSLISLFYGVLPHSLINYTAKIEAYLGMDVVVETSGLVIKGSNGDLHAPLITAIFAFGFFIALIIFLLGPKSRKVGLMDTYTAGEFLYTPELYHYSFNFYAPFERLYEKHPNIVAIYAALVERVKDLGKFIRYVFFSKSPARGVMWIIVTLILLMWGEKL